MLSVFACCGLSFQRQHLQIFCLEMGCPGVPNATCSGSLLQKSQPAGFNLRLLQAGHDMRQVYLCIAGCGTPLQRGQACCP